MIAILDIGKTNKKCFVFDEKYRIVLEKTAQLPETVDEDGAPCEDLDLLIQWVSETCREILQDERFQIKAFNVCSYGASLVYLDAAGNPLTPLYNYLKPFPETLQKTFFDTYGNEDQIALETASPLLGNLNAGLQLFALKHQKSAIFKEIKHALHLPQFVAACLHGQYFSEMTSIGCHTMLWDFVKNDYHDWVKQENLEEKLPPIQASDSVVNTAFPASKSASEMGVALKCGVGLHDSSAALIPYLACFKEPFLLLSTGTWCISLNPFNNEPLTAEELAQDCLCYLSYEGRPVKAARYFGGYEHEMKVKELAAAVGVSEDFYKSDAYLNNPELAAQYRDFMSQLIEKQVVSIRLALGNSPVRRIFIDGGFSKNNLYLQLLATVFPDMDIFAAEVAQATALGAALAIHPHWNPKPVPENLILLSSAAKGFV